MGERSTNVIKGIAGLCDLARINKAEKMTSKLSVKELDRIKKKFTWERLKKIPLQKHPFQVTLPPKKTDLGMAQLILEFGDEWDWGYNSFCMNIKGDRIGGYAKEEIFRHWPHLYHLTRWHLISANGLLYDTEIITKFAKDGDLQFAREAAAMPSATLDQLKSASWIEEQIPGVMYEFACTMRQIFGKQTVEFDLQTPRGYNPESINRKRIEISDETTLDDEAFKD